MFITTLHIISISYSDFSILLFLLSLFFFFLVVTDTLKWYIKMSKMNPNN